jgi:hypothetical protein
MWTDPSGRQVDCKNPNSNTCPDFGEGLIKRLAGEIWDVANHYAQFIGLPDWNEHTLAVLMGAILIHENHYSEVFMDRPSEDSIGTYGLFKDTSTGIANLRGKVVWEILNCQIPLGIDGSGGREKAINMDFPTLGGDRYPEMKRLTRLNIMKANTLLQEEMVSLDLLGANLVRGIRRAQWKGIQPSIINVAAWHNSGIVEVASFSKRLGILNYVNGVVEQLGAAARVLKANYIQPDDPENPRLLFGSKEEFETVNLPGSDGFPYDYTACNQYLVEPRIPHCKSEPVRLVKPWDWSQ